MCSYSYHKVGTAIYPFGVRWQLSLQIWRLYEDIQFTSHTVSQLPIVVVYSLIIGLLYTTNHSWIATHLCTGPRRLQQCIEELYRPVLARLQYSESPMGMSPDCTGWECSNKIEVDPMINQMFYIPVLCERLLDKQVSCYSSTCTFNTYEYLPTADTCLNTQADCKLVSKGMPTF